MSIKAKTPFAFLAALLIAVACSDSRREAGDAGTSDAGGFSRAMIPWKAGPAAPESGLFSEYGLSEFNPWTGDVSWAWEGDRPVVKNDRLGFYAVGNGRTFGFVGTDYPLTVLHEAYGPDYSRVDLKVIPDIVFTAISGGSEVRFRRSRIGRFANNGIVGVTSEAEGLKLSALFLSPAAEKTPYETSIVVTASVENAGPAARSGLSFAALPFAGAEDSGTPGVMSVRQGQRRAWVVLDGGKWDGARQGLAGQPFDLEPGDHADAAFVVFFTEGEAAADPAPGFLSDARKADLRALVSSTSERWSAYFSRGLQAGVPDPRVSGLLESFLYTIEVQTGWNGAISPLSHYGEYWTRDLSGPLRMLAAASRPDEVKRALDYHEAAACRRGGFFNAAEVDYTVGEPCAVNDWSALPVMTGKTAAEAPSYIPHLYVRLFDATGDGGLIRERLPMLRYALEKQAFSPEHFLPFSDDETFRPPMGVNTGVGGATYVWHENAWSLQSSLLFLAASGGIVRAAGLPEDDPILRLRGRVLENVDRYYWDGERGIFLPFVLFNGMDQYRHPYEDVNLTIQWMHLEDTLGAARVKSDLDTLVSEAWRENRAMVQTWRGTPVELMWYRITEGIFTGMTPGFALYAAAGHRPDIAEKVFNSFPSFITPSGNATEVYSTADMIPLMPIYERNGDWSEVWSRFRPWEGGQDGEAVIYYLTGLKPDAASRSVRLAPRLPDNWPSASYRGLLAAGCSIDLEVRELSDGVRGHRLSFSGEACAGLSVEFRGVTWNCGERNACTPVVSAEPASGGETKDDPSGTVTFKASPGAVFTVTSRSPDG